MDFGEKTKSDVLMNCGKNLCQQICIFKWKNGSETCNELWLQRLNRFLTKWEPFDIQPEKN